MKAKFKKGDIVTAWRNPIHYKYNTGQIGEIVDVIDTINPIIYVIKLENGNVQSTDSYITNRSF